MLNEGDPESAKPEEFAPNADPVSLLYLVGRALGRLGMMFAPEHYLEPLGPVEEDETDPDFPNEP